MRLILAGNWQDALDLVYGFNGSIHSFRCNSRQCTDLADYIEYTLATDLQLQFAQDKERWMRIGGMCQPAMTELCSAIVDAELFLHDCSSQADFQQQWNSIIKLETREAYDVLLHNLIWSKAGLDVAILYAEAADKDGQNNLDYVQIIKKRVDECTSLLSSYSIMATQPRINGDRNELYRSVKNSQRHHLQLYSDEFQKKRLTFLVGKVQAHQKLSQDAHGAGGGSALDLQLNDFQIDPHDLTDYTNQELIGEGASAYVYSSCWLGQTVAVKVVWQGDRAFEQEVSLLARLRSPFIVHLVGWCKKGSHKVLVTELAHTDLLKVISSGKTLSVHAAVDMMLQISKGMEYLHERGVIHGNIKPGTVLLEPSSVKDMAAEGYARVKLCGFGLARMKQLSTEHGNQYATPKVGTSYYRAPEVLLNNEVFAANKYTCKADVFSFGILGSEILGGRSATSCYDHEKPIHRTRLMLQNVRPSLPSDCPSHLADLIRRCWDPNPNGRPSFSSISSTLTYIKFVLMRVSNVQRVRVYESVVSPFDEDELRMRVSRDEHIMEGIERIRFAEYRSKEEDRNSDGDLEDIHLPMGEWQDAVDLLNDFISGRINSFKCNSRQCIDLANYLHAVATALHHQPYEGVEGHRMRTRVMCEPAMKEFCRAIIDAKLFLHDCSWQANFQQSLNSIIKLDTREAHDVLLHNLVWSKAGLDVAISYAEAAEHNNNHIGSGHWIQRRVDECTSRLSRYSIKATQAQLNGDRNELYCSIENSERLHLQLYSDETQKKCLTFLVEKSKALQESSQDIYESGGGSTHTELQLDKFQIDPRDLLDDGKQKILGSGNYGLVRRYSWLGQTVAAKVFRGLTHQNELFKNEASLLARLRNPFIVHMMGWCEKDGDCVLVMELVRTDLYKVIKSNRTLSMFVAVDIMLQISKGMEYLHEKKVIHRDIKPGNVLLEPSSVKEMAAEGYARVKLCDFGLAKVKKLSAEDQSRYTTLKWGTSYYRAPEVLADNDEARAKYDRKADVFSFGITCSEILGGLSATDCYHGKASAKAVRTCMLQNVRPSLPSDCPSHLVNLIRRCWDTDPGCRPPFSRISSTLTYIKFIMMRVSGVQRSVRVYDSVVSLFDEDELRRREGTVKRPRLSCCLI